MGVAGCGKSTAAQAVARELQWSLLEGDDYHAESSKEKMRRGVALVDEDRATWLATLGQMLAAHQSEGKPVALTCSALKRNYRDLLRARSPGLRFVFLEIDKMQAQARVAARGVAHLFPPSLVDSQFVTLEPPHGEPGVLCIDALMPHAELAERISDWLRKKT